MKLHMAKRKPKQTLKSVYRAEQFAPAEFPSYPLASAVEVASLLWDPFEDVATSIDRIVFERAEEEWQTLILMRDAVTYGLISIDYSSGTVSLTDLGRRLVAPIAEGQDDDAKIEALLCPRLMGAFFLKYDGGIFPRENI
ncbi:MAG: hypothetical protein K8U03_08545, partial [Planctomycetia bacterium]|nr:hypothetical protein [Planctomycetia bacterium]